MNPDISYILRFEKTSKDRLIEALKDFCINTEENNFDPALISDDCSISFVLNMEHALNWYHETHETSRQVKGKIVIGIMQLWIREMQNEIIFEFWAPSSTIGKACLASKNLVNEFIQLVENNHGLEIKLDHSNGLIETIYTKSNFDKN